jgi:hypothetical protein
MPRQLPLQRAIPQYTGAGRLRPYTSVKRRECVAKLTTHISIRGVDLKDMLQQAREQLADLSDATFTVTDVDLYVMEDIADKEGMARLWSASFTMEANVDL